MSMHTIPESAAAKKRFLIIEMCQAMKSPPNAERYEKASRALRNLDSCILDLWDKEHEEGLSHGHG